MTDGPGPEPPGNRLEVSSWRGEGLEVVVHPLHAADQGPPALVHVPSELEGVEEEPADDTISWPHGNDDLLEQLRVLGPSEVHDPDHVLHVVLREALAEGLAHLIVVLDGSPDLLWVVVTDGTVPVRLVTCRDHDLRRSKLLHELAELIKHWPVCPGCCFLPVPGLHAEPDDSTGSNEVDLVGFQRVATAPVVAVEVAREAVHSEALELRRSSPATGRREEAFHTVWRRRLNSRAEQDPVFWTTLHRLWTQSSLLALQSVHSRLKARGALHCTAAAVLNRRTFLADSILMGIRDSHRS
mmetsp:Transcript_58018/g.125411  ORF Transcript_58018/g.125411 Transcript_58018/m.125411 type:complete len:298 (-) Transcript_58018:713-1606(-)